MLVLDQEMNRLLGPIVRIAPNEVNLAVLHMEDIF